MDIFHFVLLFLTGIAGGFISGLLGIGGGPLFIAVYSTYVQAEYSDILNETDAVKIVLASSIYSVMWSGISASFRNWKAGNFYPRTILFLGLPAIVTAFAITIFISHIHLSRAEFSLVFICLMLPMIIRMLIKSNQTKKFNHPQSIKTVFLILTGVISGIFTSLSGLGGGFAIIPLLNGLFNIKIRKVLSISLGVIMLVAGALTLFNLFYYDFSDQLNYTVGAVNFAFTLPVILGVVLASNWGVSLGQKLPPHYLRYGVIAFCLLIILKTTVELIMTNDSLFQ